MALTTANLEQLYGKAGFKLHGNIFQDFAHAIDAALGAKHQDAACILRGYLEAALSTPKQRASMKTPQDACGIDLGLDGALHVLQQKDGPLAQLVAGKFKAKPPTDTTGYVPTAKKPPAKDPQAKDQPAVVQTGKPINWKPVLKWGGLGLAAAGIGYFAWQHWQAR